MEAKSKFDIGELIFFMNGGMPVKAQITGINMFSGWSQDNSGCRTESKKGESMISYYTQDYTTPVREFNAFASKEELQKSLFDNL